MVRKSKTIMDMTDIEIEQVIDDFFENTSKATLIDILRRAGFFNEFGSKEINWEGIMTKKEKQANDSQKELENDIYYLNDFYEVKNYKMLKKYLLVNPDLIDILVNAQEEIKSLVEPYEVSLQLEADFDYYTLGTEQLYMTITIYAPIEEVLKLEDKVYSEWFLKTRQTAHGRLYCEFYP